MRSARRSSVRTMRSFLAALFVTFPALAAPDPAAVLRMLQSAVEFRDVALSRDGARVAWVEQVPTADGPSPDQSIIQVLHRAVASSAPIRVTAAKDGQPHDEHDLDFSPDGRTLAFLSDALQPHQPQLFVADLGSGAVRQLTRVSGHLARPRFSPDGREIAVLFIEGGADEEGPLKPASRRTGVIDERVKEQRLALVPADGSAPLRAVSPADLFIYEYDWRGDGGAIAATGAHGSGDDNWWVAKLFFVDLRTGAARVVHSPSLQICEPTFSPDGSRIAFIEGLMSDAGSNGGDVFVVPADGSAKPRNLTAGLHGTPSTLRWLQPGEILFGLQIEGTSAFASVPADGHRKPAILWRGAENLHVDWSVGAQFSADGSTSAALRETFDRPPEVVAG